MADCQCQCSDLVTQVGIWGGLSTLNNAMLVSKPGSNQETFKTALKDNNFEVVEAE